MDLVTAQANVCSSGVKQTQRGHAATSLLTQNSRQSRTTTASRAPRHVQKMFWIHELLWAGGILA
jgi:hypothetical protein